MLLLSSSLSVLSTDVGIALQKEEGESGQLSAAMDKANAVASEEQGDCWVHLSKVSRDFHFNWTVRECLICGHTVRHAMLQGCHMCDNILLLCTRQ